MSLPRITVIMPVRNEEAMIARSLGAVIAQDYPSDRVQILVADGESDDRTLAVVAALPGAERVHVLQNPERLQAPGLNRALALATGEIVVRVDGHTIIAPDYLRACVRALHMHQASVVGGCLSPVGMTTVGRAIAVASRSRFAVPSAYHLATTGQYADTVYLGAWPRAVLAHVGGFNSALAVNEDYELNWRIRRGGGRVYLDPAIRSDYYGRQSYPALARQFFGYGSGKAEMLGIHLRSLRLRHVVAPLFVLALVTLPVALLAPFTLSRLIALGFLAAYVVCNLLFAASLALRTDMRLLWRIGFAFFTMHLTWGAGFWSGAATQLGKRWRSSRGHAAMKIEDSMSVVVPAE